MQIEETLTSTIGAGACDGENIERLWSILARLIDSLRPSSVQNSMDLLFWAVQGDNEKRFNNFPSFMLDSARRLHKKSICAKLNFIEARENMKVVPKFSPLTDEAMLNQAKFDLLGAIRKWNIFMVLIFSKEKSNYPLSLYCFFVYKIKKVYCQIYRH